MEKAWRLVLIAVVFLVAAGILLAGIAWLTGASPARIAELTVDGPEGVAVRWEAAKQTLNGFWTAAVFAFRSFF